MSNVESTPNAPDGVFAQTFKERAQITQIIYQTLLQGTNKSQKETKGVPASDAELLHGLSSALAILTSSDAEERKFGWENIRSVTGMALTYIQSNEELLKAVSAEPVVGTAANEGQ